MENQLRLKAEHISLTYSFVKDLNVFILIISSCFVAEGPKLFKEPSSKSNKPIIINAIAHCCLAGKVNESQKNAVLEASVFANIYCADHCC